MCELKKSAAIMSENGNNFPFEIKDVEPELNKELQSKFTAAGSGYVRVGPKGYLLPKLYEREAALYYSVPVRPGDVFLVGFPRSGTNLTQELVWLIANDFDYEKAARILLDRRFPFLEGSIFLHPELLNGWLEESKGNEEVINELITFTTPAPERLREAPSPRFIKSHLPLSLLPPALLRTRTARVVFVARDPRDVAVSLYHLYRVARTSMFNSDFKTFWNYFIKGLVFRTPYFEYIKEGWENRHNPNVLFLFYEEISRDMPKTIKKVAKFLDKPITDEQVAKLTDHLKIDKFKKNKAVNGEALRDVRFLLPGEQNFIRKGKAGGWREHFDDEMTQQAERWLADNLRDTDLRFPGACACAADPL